VPLTTVPSGYSRNIRRFKDTLNESPEEIDSAMRGKVPEKLGGGR
jgi:hypothetical protein